MARKPRFGTTPETNADAQLLELIRGNDAHVFELTIERHGLSP